MLSTDVELGSPRSHGENWFMLSCCVLCVGVGVLALFWASRYFVDALGAVAATLFFAWGLSMLWLALGPQSTLYELWHRVFAGPDGVRAGIGGRTTYRWSEVASFDVGAGNDRGPRCTMVLHDGRRVVLRTLRDVDTGFGDVINRGAVEADVDRLRSMLDDARSSQPTASIMTRLAASAYRPS